MNAVQFLWPWTIDDARAPSGGNRYDAFVRDGLRKSGWTCEEHVVAGAWPQPDARALLRLRRTLAAFAAGTLVVVDGVMAPAGASALADAAGRLRIIVLLHMPFGAAFPELAASEQHALAASAAVITTSAWTRAWVCAHHGLPPDRVRVATPGVDHAPLTDATAAGTRLLCVANVSWLKGHDVLTAALAALRDHAWDCTCVGAPPADARLADSLRSAAHAAGIEGRLHWTGTLAGAALDAAWANADVLLLASRRESFGMVVSEALAHGLPVIATRAGGIQEALGRAPDGELPGVLVAPGSEPEFAAALRGWLEDPDLRARLRAAAHLRRPALHGWASTTAHIADVLREVMRGATRMA